MAHTLIHDDVHHASRTDHSTSGTIVNFFLWAVFGGLAGWIASLITQDGVGLGILGNILVGVAGAFIGGFIADRVGIGEGRPGADRPTSIASFIWAVIGAMLLLLVLNFIF